jgi:hypothetical protein
LEAEYGKIAAPCQDKKVLPKDPDNLSSLDFSAQFIAFQVLENGIGALTIS